MASKKISKLIREDHPKNYQGYSFITLIQFNEEKLLSIVDKLTEKALSAYILDLCAVKKIDEEQVLNIAYDWHNSDRNRFPISFEFARLNIANEMSAIHRSFNPDFVERVIGPLPEIEVAKVTVKRKKRKKLHNIQVVNKKVKQF